MTRTARAAVLWGVGQPWKIEEIQVDEPKSGELLVRWKSAGLCHSEEHMVTGDIVPSSEDLAAIGAESMFPIVGGHEGAGVVEAIGPEVHSVQVGDVVAASFVPACGKCVFCTTGRGNLCDLGSGALGGGMITDGTHRHFLNGKPVNLLVKLGTFAELTCVSEMSVVKIDKDFPNDCVAVVSCGVATGWGSATRRADVRPGDTVVVVGVGGIGMNAVQGARMAGAVRIIAVDPVEFKREKSLEFGATHTFSSMEEAIPAVTEMTYGRMADKVILCPSVMDGSMMASAQTLTAKGGTMVVTAVAPIAQETAAINLFNLGMFNKEIKGTIYGSLTPRSDIPRLLEMYRAGVLKLDELITERYTLDQINDGYQAMRDGKNIRGVVVHQQ